MKRARKLFAGVMSLGLAAALTVPATAGPTVIRDEALRDLAVTPVLGRGYSIATNTFQSICYTDLVKTKPSYNFTYTFEDVTEEQSQSLSNTGSVSGSYSGGFWGVRFSASASAKSTTKTSNNTYRHNMLVAINIDVYYSSVDESKGNFSPAALSLIKKRDLPSFFDACGMYYTRSINRNSRFLSIFSYESVTDTRDEAFEAQLEATVRGWGQSGSFAASQSREFSEKSSRSRLVIKSNGFGLGKSESANLISYDLDTFRTAVKMAFQAMQAEDVGMVTSIEVAPWVEHTEFQDTLQLDPKQVPDPADPTKTVTRTPYEQKRILTQNSEFLSELDRAARGKLNVYYKAKQCGMGIKFDYKQLSDDNVSWSWIQRNPDDPASPTWDAAQAQNHRTGKWDRTLAAIDNAVAPLKLNLIFKEYDAFMYGGSDDPSKWAQYAKDNNIANPASSPTVNDMVAYGFYTPSQFPGAAACVKDLLANDSILTGSYRNIDTCKKVEEQFGVVQGATVNDYCMPQVR